MGQVIVGKTLEAMHKSAFDPKSKDFQVTWRAATVAAVSEVRTYELLEGVCVSETSPPSFLLFMNFVKFLGDITWAVCFYFAESIFISRRFAPSTPSCLCLLCLAQTCHHRVCMSFGSVLVFSALRYSAALFCSVQWDYVFCRSGYIFAA